MLSTPESVSAGLGGSGPVGRAGAPCLTHLPPTAFTFHQFSQWLKMVTLPTMWLGAASLAWELLTALWRYIAGAGVGARPLVRAQQLDFLPTGGPGYKAGCGSSVPRWSYQCGVGPQWPCF